MGPGFEATGVYYFNNNIDGFVQSGVHIFKSDVSVYDGAKPDNILHIPFIAGARFHAGGLIAGLGIGYGFWSSNGSTSNGFLYSPQVGYDFGHYHFVIHYTETSVTNGTLAYVGLKLFRTF
jgi:hypothetical protein